MRREIKRNSDGISFELGDEVTHDHPGQPKFVGEIYAITSKIWVRLTNDPIPNRDWHIDWLLHQEKDEFTRWVKRVRVTQRARK